MSAPDEAFYTEERWENWLDRLREESPDPEDEDAARLLWNLQDDVAIAVAKILRAHGDGEVDTEEAIEELEAIHTVVLAEPELEDEDTRMLLGEVQESLFGVFNSAEQYLREGPAEEAGVDEYVRAAAAAETEEDLDRALGLIVQAGTIVVDAYVTEGDADLDPEILDELFEELVDEQAVVLVINWLDGLRSLRDALDDPEVVEEAED